jgi:biopolymer transport protein TolR
MMGISPNKNGGRKRNQLVSEINVTPLVDVMLVLLVIFMITDPMMISGVNVDLPETKSTPIKGNDEPLTISIDKKGQIFIMDTLVDEEKLVAKLKAITSSKAKMETRIFVRGDKGISYGKIMDVVGEVSAAGFRKVALITNVKSHAK